ncbi:polysaccharide pyruvyl transferase family protein [Dyella sp. A6]|uniref:polysaccharide pyruvyl transferase family protein n=1 Tax=Dyella aluminiiresistens TaxID=3069105 RepID=UPI002E793763|nr:polysaccharide pyruvyl transferase family protein [Dyella sp. A6]
MKLYYYKDRHGNFGDDLNPWLWSKLLPEMFDDDDSELFVGIGTLLNNNIPKQPRKVVFGSGAGYGSALPDIDDKWTFYCVRGPVTAARLGLAESCAITDAAALVSTVYNAHAQKRDGVAFIPHHVSARHMDWQAVCRQVGVRYIDPRRDVETVLSEIAGASAVITEAMHGAILADTFRIPWMPVVLYGHVLKSKWEDWSQSLSLEYEPRQLEGVWDPDYNFGTMDRLKIRTKRSFGRMGISPASWTPPPPKSTKKEIDRFLTAFEGLTRNPSFQLSRDSVFDSALARLVEKLDQLRRDRRIVV